jgi:MATE family multidrug resistance protein
MTVIDPPRIRREAWATLRLAGPLIGGQLAYVGMNVIDTIMAGKLDPRTLAAVALGSSAWSSLHLFMLGVLLSLPPFISEYDGAGTAEARARIAPLVRQGVWLAVALAALVVLALRHVGPLLGVLQVKPDLLPVTSGYLAALTWGVPAWALYLVLRFSSEGLSMSRPTLYFGLLGLPANAVANWVLMYGKLGFPALGAVGCGYATALVWWLQLAAFGVYVARRREYRELGLFARFEGPDPAALRRLLRIGVPIAVTIFLESSLFTAAAIAVGALGTVALAGHQVALNFAALTFMIPLGLSMAVTVRVGNALGRRDHPEVRFRAGLGVALAVTCQLVPVSLMLFAPRLIAAIYTADPAVQAVAVELLFLAAIFQLSDGLQVSSAAALRGLKDTRVPMFLTLVAYWLVGMPLGLSLCFPAGMGARGMWIGLIAGLSTAALLLGRRLLQVGRDPAAARYL